MTMNQHSIIMLIELKQARNYLILYIYALSSYLFNNCYLLEGGKENVLMQEISEMSEIVLNITISLYR